MNAYFFRPLIKQLEKLKSAEYSFMIVLAIIIGIMGGYGAIFFRYLIRFFEGIFFGDFHITIEYITQLPWYVKLLSPAIGGLIVGPIIHFYANEAKGAGLPEVIEAIAVKGGIIRRRVALAKIFASAISIGSGGSVGREGPIVQIGASVGSAIGQILKVTGTQLRTMVACGAAAGLAGTFNAPIAGAIFSNELLLGSFGIRYFSPLVISSVTATVISRYYLGNFPAFSVPSYELLSIWEFIPYVLLGVLAPFVGILFIKTIYKVTDIFNKYDIKPWIKPAIGGLFVGGIGLFVPHIYGVGYEAIGQAMSGKLTFWLLIIIILSKILATSLTVGSGGSGGVFAPSLVLGASLGAIIGGVGDFYFPEMIGNVGAYALVGMGAVSAATMHAPVTTILIVFELTNDYRIILPLMVSVILSVVIKMNLMEDSVYTAKLKRRGLDLTKPITVNVLSTIKVREVLQQDYIAVQATTAFVRLFELTQETHHLNYFVIDTNAHLLGILSPYKIREIARIHDPSLVRLTAKDLIIKEEVYFTPEDTLDKIVPLFHDYILDQVPIVNNGEDKTLIGQVTKTHLLDAYNKGVIRNDMIGSISSSIVSAGKYKEIPLSGGEVLCEVEVPGSFIGKDLVELDFRNRYKIEVILIKQNFNIEEKQADNVIVPEPHYAFKYGDRILIVGHQDDIHNFNALK